MRKILQLLTTWMEFETLMLSEISNKSERERQLLYNLIYVWNRKKQTN